MLNCLKCLSAQCLKWQVLKCLKGQSAFKHLGKFISSFQATKYGQLHYRDLERLKTKALKINKGNFVTKVSVP